MDPPTAWPLSRIRRAGVPTRRTLADISDELGDRRPMSERNDRQPFIPLCREDAHIQREYARALDETLTRTDKDFLSGLKVKA